MEGTADVVETVNPLDILNVVYLRDLRATQTPQNDRTTNQNTVTIIGPPLPNPSSTTAELLLVTLNAVARYAITINCYTASSPMFIVFDTVCRVRVVIEH